MIVNVVNVHVKKEHINDFITATIHNHKNSLQEPGNLRFDVLQSQDDPTRFILYEAYCTQQDANAHKNTQHYAVWKDTVAPWMEEPRKGTAYTVIAPLEESLWK